MLSPARRHLLRAKAAIEAAEADEFGGVRPDASVYQLQLTELKNDIHVLRSIQSYEKRAEVKKELMPKHMPYVLGVIQSGAKVEQDEVITTIMLWCFDCAMFTQGLSLAEYALQNALKMPDSFSRSTASIVAEEIGNAAHKAYQDGQTFNLEVLEKATQLTADFDMHEQIRAKLYLATGRTLLQLERGSEAVKFLKMAISKNENCGGKTDLKKAEKLFKEQLKNLPEPMLNADGSQVVDDQGTLQFHPT